VFGITRLSDLSLPSKFGRLSKNLLVILVYVDHQVSEVAHQKLGNGLDNTDTKRCRVSLLTSTYWINLSQFSSTNCHEVEEGTAEC
jgi:hypothetical protein